MIANQQDTIRITELEAELADKDKCMGMVNKEGAKYISDLKAELSQCLTAHAKLNDECERLKERMTELYQWIDDSMRTDPTYKLEIDNWFDDEGNAL